MPDAIQSAIQFAMHGLSDRSHTTNNNLANLQTPGFLAKQTDFESSLKSALSGSSTSMQSKHLTSQAPTRTDGNNVELDNETVTAMDTELRYQAMTQAMNVKFRLLKSAMGAA